MSLQDTEEQVIRYRANLKQKLKDEYRRLCFDPKRHAKMQGGYIFDSATQRYLSMVVTQYDNFRPNKKNTLQFLVALSPFVIMGYLFRKDRMQKELKYSTGQESYRDRKVKFY